MNKIPTQWGTCRYGHESKPILVKRMGPDASMVQCTYVSRKGNKCEDQFLMFDDKIIHYHEAEYRPDETEEKS